MECSNGSEGEFPSRSNSGAAVAYGLVIFLWLCGFSCGVMALAAWLTQRGFMK